MKINARLINHSPKNKKTNTARRNIKTQKTNQWIQPYQKSTKITHFMSHYSKQSIKNNMANISTLLFLPSLHHPFCIFTVVSHTKLIFQSISIQSKSKQNKKTITQKNKNVPRLQQYKTRDNDENTIHCLPLTIFFIFTCTLAYFKKKKKNGHLVLFIVYQFRLCDTYAF